MILYVRLGCHLCDEVCQILSAMGIVVTRIDIDRDEELKEQYDVLIPVLYDPARDRELIYPFAQAEIEHFINT